MSKNRNKEQLIGWIILKKPYVKTLTYETAAWYSEVEIPAGRYPIIKKGSQIIVPAIGTWIYVWTPSLWGGVAIGGQPMGNKHRDVGTPWAGYLLSFYGSSFWVDRPMARIFEVGTTLQGEADVELFGVGFTYSFSESYNHDPWNRIPNKIKAGYMIRTYGWRLTKYRHPTMTELKLLPPPGAVT